MSPGSYQSDLRTLRRAVRKNQNFPEGSVAPFPHLKTVLVPNESGSGGATICEGGVDEEVGEEIKGAGETARAA